MACGVLSPSSQCPAPKYDCVPKRHLTVDSFITVQLLLITRKFVGVLVRAVVVSVAGVLGMLQVLITEWRQCERLQPALLFMAGLLHSTAFF